MAKLKKTMFREYDLRGRISSDELNGESVAIIAKAHGTMLRRRGIKDAVVGHDYRPTSEKFKDITIRGLASAGVNFMKRQAKAMINC